MLSKGLRVWFDGRDVIIGMADQGFLGPASNQTCQFCEGDVATHFCKCTGSPTLFCRQCFPTHQAKYPRALHPVMPVAALYQTPDEYKRKYDALTKVTAELRKNLDKMEQCSTDFADMVQTCIHYLEEYRSWWLQQLQTSKEELALAIETAIREATDCLDQGMEPGSALWTLTDEELQVF